MATKKENKTGYLTIKQASQIFNIPEQTWRAWWRDISNAELQKLFRRIPGTTKILVHIESVLDAIENDLLDRLKTAEEF